MPKEANIIKKELNEISAINSIKGFAILWIFLVHFIERFMAGSNFGNPGLGWPSFSERITQLLPLQISGVRGVFINTLRYTGWLGDQGVQLFLIVAGFTLTWSLLKGNNFSLTKFYKKRLFRILPLWWLYHGLFIFVSIIVRKGLLPGDWRTWASFFGARFIPEVLYYFSPAWWFIGLLLQVYLIFPFIFSLLKKYSYIKFFLIIIVPALIIRLAGLFFFREYLDWWSRGGIFISRLPEIAFGMVFAKMLFENPKKIDRWLGNWKLYVIAISIYIIGNIASFTLGGMSIALFFTGIGAFILVFQLFSRGNKWANKILGWLGKKSYSIFLFHHPVLIILVKTNLDPSETGKIISLLFITLIISIIGAVLIENIFILFTVSIKKFSKEIGIKMFFIILSSIAIGFYCLLLIAELSLISFKPQEVLGWGERPSLEQDNLFGYKLIPDKTTRLRWLSYDYTVKANSLGFPGVLYPEKNYDNKNRILVTGDAFESAEGVDTNLAWPWLLETQLIDNNVQTEIFNFSITGWGPNQYLAAIREYAPIYKPDIVLVGFFVNEFFDINASKEGFQMSIGFQNPRANGFYSVIRLLNLRSFIRQNIIARAKEMVLSKPNSLGYLFGYFSAFEINNLSYMGKSSDLIYENFKKIKAITDSLDADLLIVLVPASIQIQNASQLPYYPNSINFADTDRFDPNQPQRLTIDICSKLNIPYVDLRSAFKESSSAQYYQPWNMHWTEEGHDVVSKYMSQELIDNYIFEK